MHSDNILAQSATNAILFECIANLTIARQNSPDPVSAGNHVSINAPQWTIEHQHE